MTALVCQCCAPRPEHEVIDARGKRWRFENSRMFGPIVLRADGEPAARQPGERSAFWSAYETWLAQAREEAAT